MKEELEWIRSNPKARQAKSKARIKNYEERLKDSKEKRVETNEIFIPAGQRLGDVVINASGLSKSFGEKTLYKDLSFKLPPGGIVGVIGPNGVGKSTLFRMITGQETPDAGEITIGETVQLAYVDQSREMDPSKTIYQVVSGGTEMLEVGGREVNAELILQDLISLERIKKRL